MLKRLFDISFSLFGLILLSPFLLIAALFIKKEDSGSVFYRGERVGLYGKLFNIYKFRTMVPNADKIGPSSTAGDDPRLTRIGKVLKKYKLDELPQLINVLKGEMSLVGPRPQVPWAVDQYSSDEKVVLEVRPGITDYASIKFRNEGEILAGSDDPDRAYMEIIHPEKMRLAIEYVKNRTLFIDIKIVFLTIVKLFTKQMGIYK